MLIYYIKYFLYTKIERDVFTEKILLKVVVLSLIVYIHILKIRIFKKFFPLSI